MARCLDTALPADLRFYAVGVKDATAFGEGLSAGLVACLPTIAAEILSDLGVGLEGVNP